MSAQCAKAFLLTLSEVPYQIAGGDLVAELVLFPEEQVFWGKGGVGEGKATTLEDSRHSEGFSRRGVSLKFATLWSAGRQRESMSMAARRCWSLTLAKERGVVVGWDTGETGAEAGVVKQDIM
eukprot:TRINITY_DN93_c0_g1_i1.p1 TRINITY_DN93_c0_g1~~TRINITY_DN93_c0_g1_i1.p1  ORF type:complete len:123 (-),score=9.31 TRINITY_DN93_c0_g1_i1:1175-1543(-)